jgi:phosphopantetheinyl transferase (holo-ACP synthase)
MNRAPTGEIAIIGMGVDLAEVGRIQKAIERHGETFLRRAQTGDGAGAEV